MSTLLLCVCVCATVKIQFDNNTTSSSTSTCNYALPNHTRPPSQFGNYATMHLLPPPIPKFWIRPCLNLIGPSVESQS